MCIYKIIYQIYRLYKSDYQITIERTVSFFLFHLYLKYFVYFRFKNNSLDKNWCKIIFLNCSLKQMNKQSIIFYAKSRLKIIKNRRRRVILLLKQEHHMWDVSLLYLCSYVKESTFPPLNDTLNDLHEPSY